MGKTEEVVENTTEQASAEAEHETTTATAAGKEKAGESAAVFTQEEVNKLLGKVRQETREKTAKKELDEILGRFGAESLDELETIVKEYKELKLASMTELERMQSELEEARQKSLELEAILTEKEAAAQEALIKSAVVSAAAGRFEDAEAAYRLLDMAEVSVEEDGSVSGIEAALDKLAEKYPFMLRKSGPSRVSPANPPKSEPQGRTDDDRRAEYFGIRSNRANPFFTEGGGVVISQEPDTLGPVRIVGKAEEGD